MGIARSDRPITNRYTLVYFNDNWDKNMFLKLFRKMLDKQA